VTGGLTIADAEKFQYATKLAAADSFKELLSEIGDEITRYYVLELSEPTTKGKPTKWRLELTRDGSKRRDVVLTYPQRLFTCVALQAHK